MRRIVVLFATQLLLWTIVSQLNHALTGARVYLFAAALYVAPGALAQSFRPGLLTSALAGLLCDATTPVAFGTHMLLFSAAHVAIFHLRDRLPREDALGQSVMVLLVNFGIFIAFSFTQIYGAPAPGVVWARLLVDLVCSQMFLALITPWFIALQLRVLVLARVERENFA